MNCVKCKSDRVVEVFAKHSDLLCVQYHDASHDGYNDLGLTNLTGNSGNDYLEFDYCLECGQIQGEWPVAEPDFA